MLSGDNSILQRTTDAKIRTEKAQIIENAQTDILGQQTENKGTSITKEQLVAILNKYFNTTTTDSIPDEISTEQGHDLTLTTNDAKYTIMLSEIFKGKFSTQNNLLTFGEKYQDSMLGKTINYTSGANNVTDWIIFGKQVNAQGKNDIIITTKNPVSTQTIDFTLAEWIGYEEKLNNACKTYVGQTGTLGTKGADIKEVRSITLGDINNIIGFTVPEIFDEVVFGVDNNFAYPKEDGSGWIKNTDSNYLTTDVYKRTYLNNAYSYNNYTGTCKYASSKNGGSFVTLPTTNLSKSNNMNYIFANGISYWVASRTVDVSSENAKFIVNNVAYRGLSGREVVFCTSNADGGTEPGRNWNAALRPCVVLSSEIAWDEVKDLIGNYATY